VSKPLRKENQLEWYAYGQLIRAHNQCPYLLLNLAPEACFKVPKSAPEQKDFFFLHDMHMTMPGFVVLMCVWCGVVDKPYSSDRIATDRGRLADDGDKGSSAESGRGSILRGDSIPKVLT